MFSKPFFRWSVPIGKAFSRFREEAAMRTDKRIKAINEIISAVRTIKMCAWEKPFIKLIRLYRNVEMKTIRRASYLRAFFVTLSFVSSKLTIFPTLAALVLSGNQLTANQVYKLKEMQFFRDF